jgi:hypothetical protein
MTEPRTAAGRALHESNHHGWGGPCAHCEPCPVHGSDCPKAATPPARASDSRKHSDAASDAITAPPASADVIGACPECGAWLAVPPASAELRIAADLYSIAADLYSIAVGEHGHDETHSADWPSCLPVHVAMNRYRKARAAEARDE